MKTIVLFSSVLFLCINMSVAQFAHWPLKTSVEEVIAANDGYPQGSINFVNDPVMGDVLELSGAGYVELPVQMLTDVTDLTITCWFNYAGVANWERVYSFGYSNVTETVNPSLVQTIYLVPRDGGGKLHMTYQATGPWYDMVDGTPPNDSIEPGTWYFSAFVKKADTIRFYLNDHMVPGFERTGVMEDPSQLNDSMNWIGRSHWVDATFSGKITDLRIYKSALSQAELLEMYTPVSKIIEMNKPAEPLIYASNGRIIIETGELVNVRHSAVEVFNILGKLVYQTNDISRLNNVEFKNGIYFVKLSADNNRYVEKLLIHH